MENQLQSCIGKFHSELSTQKTEFPDNLDSTYNKEQLTAYLFLPKNASPPFQTVLYFPHAGAIYQRNFDFRNLSEYDFIVMPITPTTAFKIGEHSSNPVEMYLADLFSVQANVAGVPGISIPCGVDNSGLPIGIQILADDFNEAGMLAFASSIFKSL